MDIMITALAMITLIYLTLTLLEFLVGFQSIQPLAAQSTAGPNILPPVSIIASALNEETDIAASVENFLNIDYPDLEVIIINDRSSDNTASILNNLQTQYPQLKIKHITALPRGWFGKNHALYQGSRLAKGEWILFTDADIQMQPDTLTRAMRYVQQEKLQHLTIAEAHIHNTFWLKILLLAQYLLVSLAMQPWRIRYQWSKQSLGYGAFNLVEKAAYEAAGTHQAIAMECLDDLKLGELMKKKGFKQDTVNGFDFIKRQWYSTLPAMIRGWEKNSFAFFNYQPTLLLGATVFALLLFIWPIIAMCCLHGYAQVLNAINVLLLGVMAAYVCHQYRLQLRFALFYPVSIMLLLYAIWNSVIVTYRQNGIYWRDTFYSLADLRKE